MMNTVGLRVCGSEARRGQGVDEGVKGRGGTTHQVEGTSPHKHLDIPVYKLICKVLAVLLPGCGNRRYL